MGKMKLYELAKELNLTSKELLDKAKMIGIDAKSHLSGLEDEDVKKLRDEFSEKRVPKKNEKQENNNVEKKERENRKSKNDSTSDKKQKDRPVIIRREVIFENEENKKI